MPSGPGLDATLRDFVAGQKLFNRYTVKRILGRGGMGVVWLARDDVLEREVSLKFLPELVLFDRCLLNDLKRELIAASSSPIKISCASTTSFTTRLQVASRWNTW